MGVALLGLSDDAWELLLLPAAYLVLVAFLGFGLWLLAGPAEPAFEDLANVLGMKSDAEVTQDDLLDAGCRPQVVGPAMLGGPLQQEGLQGVQLVIGEGGGAADRLGIETAWEVGLAQPAMQRDTVDAKSPRDDGRGLTFPHGGDGPLAEEFAFSSSSWSSHDLFYAASA
jgi:hypothetical protein